ncbi:MAG TPA: ABC transporter permease [Puia sp.]|nr:ABC transporter permease [Puia sp.]
MLKNYFKIAWRSISRNRMFSLLNVAGLAIGMAVALLIGLWVYYQYSFDRFLPGYDHAYQIKFNEESNGQARTQPEVCLPLAEVLKRDIPEIAMVARAFGPVRNPLVVGDKRLYPHGMIVGEDFLKIFQFPVLRGDANEALKGVSSIVLTQSTAKALFGDEDPLNKTIKFYGENYTVTAVLKDLPRNSTFQFDYLTSFSTFASGGWVKQDLTQWSESHFLLYASLKPGSNFEAAAGKSKMLVRTYAPDVYKMNRQQVLLAPLKDWHLYTEYTNGVGSGGMIDYVRLFAIIGFWVLLIACINFMNLSTARSEKRAREVGVRKAIGSTRKSLIWQFLLESVFMTCLAMVISVLFILLALPLFNRLTGSFIAIPFGNIYFWLIVVSYALLTGLLAGSGPAFYLSSFRPIKVLKGSINVGKAATLPRKILVVLQFSFSIALIIGTMVIYQQIQFAKNRPIGYDPNRLVTTDAGNAMGGTYAAFKDEVMKTGVVTSITKSLFSISDMSYRERITEWPGKMPNETFPIALMCVSDSDYFRTIGMHIKEGRNFTGRRDVDSLCVVLNEAAVKRMRLQQPLNQYISWSGTGMPNRLRIIGIAQDALSNSPFSTVEPAMFVFEPDLSARLTYRLAPTVNARVAIERLKPIFEKYNQAVPYEYHFEDENYSSKFHLEELVGNLAGLFSLLAVFISCLGLFGLAAYVAEQRNKEIAIRKVLGASVVQMWGMLSKDFVVLVVISCLVASPIAFYFLHNWLQQYSYRISIGPMVFLIASTGAIVITLITVSFQSIKAALANPVKNLRSE